MHSTPSALRMSAALPSEQSFERAGGFLYGVASGLACKLFEYVPLSFFERGVHIAEVRFLQFDAVLNIRKLCDFG